MRQPGFKNPRAIKAMSEERITRADKNVMGYKAAGAKKCSQCEAVLDLQEFRQYYTKEGKERYEAWCKECGVLQRKRRRQKDHYNLSLEESDKIVEHQNHCCAICKSPITKFRRGLATDHDHKTGLIRGKLCWFCNKLLGIAKDNPERLLNAALYLVCPPAVDALGAPRFGLPGLAGTKKQRKLAKKLAKNPVVRTFVPQNPIEWLQKVLDLS